MGDGVVTLWDVRAPGDLGPAAVIRSTFGDVRWLHLDEGHSLGGYMLLSGAAGEAVQIYDVRRVSAGRAA